LVSARLSGLCEYSNHPGLRFLFLGLVTFVSSLALSSFLVHATPRLRRLMRGMAPPCRHFW
jgi:hypothetical protein